MVAVQAAVPLDVARPLAVWGRRGRAPGGPRRRDDAMRRDTAIRRLRLIAERCGQVSRMRPVLCSAEVVGELPEGVAELGLWGPVASTAWHL
jgi:hypothetical protein